MTLDDILRKLEALPDEKRAELTARVLDATKEAKWVPNPGPQTAAVLSPADVLLYGGAGGGGKTDTLLGLALTRHKRSLIVRRQYSNLTAVLDRAIEINGPKGVNKSPPPRILTDDGRVVDFGAANQPGDEQAWQGQAHDFFGADEATQFLESQIRFFMGWLRTTDETQRVRAVLATNPPLSAEGDYIIGMFRPWLDLTHPKPAQAGELRWFVTAPDGSEVEVDGPLPVTMGGRDLIPTSRTFIPAKLADNPFLVNSGYAAKLDALPEPLRSAVRDGNFMLAREDDPWQVIPSDWVRQAQGRWRPEQPDHAPMSSMGVDVAQGGSDQTVIAIRYDGWFAPLIAVPGAETPLGADVAGLILSKRRNGCCVVLDMGGGYGGAAFEQLKANGIDAMAYRGAEGSVRRTADQALGFQNKRAEAWWKFREALDPSQLGGSMIALPDDPELVSDLTAPRYSADTGRIKIELKDKIRERIGRSPDKGDAVVMSWFGGPRLMTHGNLWRGYTEENAPQPVRVVMSRMKARRR